MIPALRRLRQEDCDLEISPGLIAGPCQKKRDIKFRSLTKTCSLQSIYQHQKPPMHIVR
jgi:hypothetical protein